MYLERLTLSNFRSCRDTTILFQPELTLLVGENNSGKSNVIDAIRLMTSPATGRRTTYFALDDVSYGADSTLIEMHAELAQLTAYQQAQYTSASKFGTDAASYSLSYVADEHLLPRRRVSVTAGEPPAYDAEPEKREQINHVYLAPLRDAQYELDSAAGNRLSNIVRHLVTKESREDFLRKANDSLQELEDHPALTGTSTTVQGHLTKLTAPVRAQSLGIGFESFKLHRLTRSLRIKMAEHGIDLADLADSGLGYANLLYLATVILELSNADDSELTLFLVEEPEAHLHPQLQAVLLDYLREQARSSLQDDRSRPAGRIQVIATSHSPNLTSAVGIENVVALRTASVERGRPVPDGEGPDRQDETEDAAAAAAGRDGSEPHHATDHFHNTVALPLREAALTEREFKKINQYLDVTRAELLFAPRAVLVEGISEAILLPRLAKIALTEANYAAFRGISVIPVGSVDFEPYIKLLVHPINGIPLVDRLAVLTDRDPELAGEEDGEEDSDVDAGDALAAQGNEPLAEEAELADDGAVEEVFEPGERKTRLEALAPPGHEQVLSVKEAAYTLEADLLAEGGNNVEVLRQAFLRQKPRSTKRWAQIASSPTPAMAFYRALRKKGRFIGKGEFAHDIALLLAEGEEFVCPGYIREALYHVLMIDDSRSEDGKGVEPK